MGSKQYDSVESFLDYMVVYKDEEKSTAKASKTVKVMEISRELPLAGTIMSIGPGWHDVEGVFHATTHKPGDRVIFNRFAGYQYVLNGIDFIRLREYDLYGDNAKDQGFFSENNYTRDIQFGD